MVVTRRADAGDRRPTSSPHARQAAALALAATSTLALAACGAATANDVTAPCDAMADVPWYPDADALADDAATIVIGAVTGVARSGEPVEGADAGGLATVYAVDVQDVLRGGLEAGDRIDLWETCTAETSRTQLDADDGTPVLFFANAHGALIGQSQGRLVEGSDGSFRADVENLETPTVGTADLDRFDDTA
jgi:hypothetical protein